MELTRAQKRVMIVDAALLYKWLYSLFFLV